MRSLLEVMKSALRLTFDRIEDGKAWYILYCADEVGVRLDWTMSFSIPIEETTGGVFRAHHDDVQYFQRWIRKQLLHDEKQLTEVNLVRDEAGIESAKMCGVCKWMGANLSKCFCNQ